MGRTYKIKSYKRIYRRSIGSIVLQWLLILGGLALLFLLGWKLYEPITDFFSGNGEENPPVTEQETEAPSEAEKTPEPTPLPPSEPSKPAESAPVVEELPPITTPAERTAYLPEAVVLDADAFTQAVADAKEAGMDSVMFDLKDRDGWVIYPIEYKEGFDDYFTAGDTISLKDAAKQIREAGMKPIASIYTFMDRRYQQADTYAGILYKGSESFWLDNALNAGGKSWLNPYSPLARDYICKLMSDAAEAGFGEIVLREFRFPVGYSMEQMEFVYDNGQSKLDCLKEADDYFRTYAEELGVDLWIEYPAVNMNGGDIRPYGGDAMELLEDGCIIDLTSVDSASLSDTISAIKAMHPSADLAGLVNSDEQISTLQAAGIGHYIRIK